MRAAPFFVAAPDWPKSTPGVRHHRAACLLPCLNPAAIPKHIAIPQINGPQRRVIRHPALHRLAIKDQRNLCVALQALLKRLLHLLGHPITELSGLRGLDRWGSSRQHHRTAQHIKQDIGCLLGLDQFDQALGRDHLTAGQGCGRWAVHRAVVQLWCCRHAKVLPFVLGQLVQHLGVWAALLLRETTLLLLAEATLLLLSEATLLLLAEPALLLLAEAALLLLAEPALLLLAKATLLLLAEPALLLLAETTLLLAEATLRWLLTKGILRYGRTAEHQRGAGSHSPKQSVPVHPSHSTSRVVCRTGRSGTAG